MSTDFTSDQPFVYGGPESLPPSSWSGQALWDEQHDEDEEILLISSFVPWTQRTSLD